jgi:hypothetical protein
MVAGTDLDSDLPSLEEIVPRRNRQRGNVNSKMVEDNCTTAAAFPSRSRQSSTTRGQRLHPYHQVSTAMMNSHLLLKGVV